MKKGDKVKCNWINPEYKSGRDLTVGKEYVIIEKSGDDVAVIDDKGDLHNTFIERATFEPVTDQQPEPIDKGEKYQREIASGVFVDIYDVLEAWGVSCPARQHAIKKLLAAGQRGHKSEIKDLQEAQHSAHRAIMFQIEREKKANGKSLSDSIAD